ncbi:MAG: UDP-N-acetylmuramoyl-tripeptide--D-alanyl-D-alanine ligase [Cardiobacteriaceae bacterium]|nr:UDP-N-acetylmuramoyl-tripeptide--D-alanyl-D-alanine ligase [Cardiobacteriaceae bacterium]
MAGISAFTARDIVDATGGTRSGADFTAWDVSTDTRSLKAGDLFVALDGEHFRGADFLAQAEAAGAVAAVVSEKSASALPQIVVADTRVALGQIARWRRRQSRATVFAMTGSNGKTTTKEILAAILARAGETLYTQGNLNNDIGVPLTLLRLRDAHRYAVIEMGANHLGEIDYLAKLALPDVAVITNVAPAHLEGFGDFAGVISAKTEIYAASEGAVAVNLDTPASDAWLALTSGRKRLTFSMQNDNADCHAAMLDAKRFRLTVQGQSAEIAWQLVGAHNVMNALAACASALLGGIDFATVCAALDGFNVANSRLTALAVGSHTVYDDTYNANPASFKAGIAVLRQPALVIAGKMAELGADSAALHTEVAAFAREQGVGEFWAVGEHADDYAAGFPGLRSFADAQSAGSALREWLAAHQGGQVLVKGSRSAAMENVLHAAGLKT